LILNGNVNIVLIGGRGKPNRDTLSVRATIKTKQKKKAVERHLKRRKKMVSRAMQEVAYRATSSQSSDTVVPTQALKEILKEGEDTISKLVTQVADLRRENMRLADSLAGARASVDSLKKEINDLRRMGISK